MDVDPLASVRIWGVEIELAGRTFDIPAKPAADWWPVFLSGNPTEALDFILSNPDDPESIDELLLTGEIAGEELAEALIDALEEVAGRPFQVAAMLAMVTVKHWAEVNGTLVRSGFRWDEMPIGAALDALYSIWVENFKPEDRVKFDAMLDRPIPGTRRRIDRQQAMQDFEAIAGPRPTSRPASAAPSDSEPPRTPR